MTICVGALASGGRSIVCVADKAVSYGNYIQWEADAVKMVRLKQSGLVVAISGNEMMLDRVLRKLSLSADIENSDCSTRTACERAYQEARDELIEADILRPRLLSRDEYLKAILTEQINPYVQSIADEVSNYKTDNQLLVCGFHPGERDNPCLVEVNEKGIATSMERTGYHAIGSGWDRATARLLWSDYKRSSPIERVLYDLFDAKAHAEMSVGVGYEWDAVILVPGKVEIVPQKIKQLIESVWVEHNKGPYEDPDSESSPPPKTWRSQLRSYAASILPESPKDLSKLKQAKRMLSDLRPSRE